MRNAPLLTVFVVACAEPEAGPPPTPTCAIDPAPAVVAPGERFVARGQVDGVRGPGWTAVIATPDGRLATTAVDADGAVSARVTVDAGDDGLILRAFRDGVLRCEARRPLAVRSLPRAWDVRVTPTDPWPEEPLACAWRVDGEADRVRVHWEIDGRVVGTGHELPGRTASGGDEVTCVVEPGDGDRSGGAARGSVVVADPAPSNVLLVIADDLGADGLGVFGRTDDPPYTPVIDDLAREGVVFRNAYADPVCSPTRATLQTGQYAFRTGVTSQLLRSDPKGLPTSAVVLPELLAASPGGAYASAFFGKWHLGTTAEGLRHPNLSGYSWFQGTFTGFNADEKGNPESYWDWEKVTNGEKSRETRYATTVTVDDALAHLPTLTEPWLVVVSFNAPHEPLHWPPAALWTGRLTGETRGVRQLRAMTEALDTELGRLLVGLGDARARTNVIFVGDNGPWAATISPPMPAGLGKGTPFEGGVRVPLLVSGPAVRAPGRSSEALAQTTDVFSTIADLGRVAPRDVPEHDGISLLPVLRTPDHPGDREYVFAERRTPVGTGPWTGGSTAIRDARWKLVQNLETGEELLFDLTEGAYGYEQTDLLAAGPLDADAATALVRLRAARPD